MNAMIPTLKNYLRPAVRATRRLVEACRRSARLLRESDGGLAPEAMLISYLRGRFPLGRPCGRVDWERLDVRGVIPIDGVHVSKRLKTYLRKEAFDVRFDQRFNAVVAGCADREETWINEPLARAYGRLHARGVAHSVEAYQAGQLVGGGYGLAIGRVFFLESMFCTVDHASKVAFVRLADKLARDGFEWIDCQYLSEHWKRFGAQPMPSEELTRHALQGLDCGGRFSQPIDDLDLFNEAEPIDELVAASES